MLISSHNVVIELENLSNGLSEVLDPESVVEKMSHEKAEEISTPLVETLKALETALDGIDRLGVAIRQSSSASLAHRIAAFMQKKDDGLVERFAFLRLKHKLVDNFQNKDRVGPPPLSLCRQLAASISFRYFGLRYQREHQENLKRRRHGDQEERSQSVGNQTWELRKSINFAPKPDIRTAIRQFPGQRLQDAISADEHSRLDSKVALQKYQSPRSSFSVRSAISVLPENFSYPAPPRSNTLEKEVSCPYCGQILAASILEQKPVWE